MTQRKQITSQRRAKQAAKKQSAARKKSGKQSSGIKAQADFADGERGVKPALPSKSQVSEPQWVEIEKPVYGGAFLARPQGRTVFVPLTLPGEQARVRITRSKSGYAAAEPEEILRAAQQRITPACPHFGACGGCHYQHTDYATQLGFKQVILRETLERGGAAVPAEIAVLRGEPWAYRNRVRLAFDAAGNPGYRGRRSHAVVPIRECPIAAPLLVKAALAAAKVTRHFAPAFQPTEIALFCNPEETALLATVFSASAPNLRFDEFALALQAEIPELTGAELAIEGSSERQDQSFQPRSLALWGASSLTYRAAGFDYRVDHGAFFQVNRWLVDSLVQRVVGGRRGSLAWDLFAGVGLFARQLATSFARVVAVESAPSATAALAANLSGTSGDAVNAETLAFLRRQNLSVKPELVVVDPPRTGLGAQTCALLAEVAAAEMVYVSCDPATLARDMRALIASGYQIESVTLADLFPQTFHLETVVQLRRA
ncbi:MAG: 23S rRNA (uracil(1939)-C(5))-methyltransferase RlmD [Terracidiphilus sp.]|jgi:23S rRNA (uracil1939-C5)-methyltransferase